jgi:hypothetical protein
VGAAVRISLGKTEVHLETVFGGDAHQPLGARSGHGLGSCLEVARLLSSSGEPSRSEKLG